jgi:hypothetical protein
MAAGDFSDARFSAIVDKIAPSTARTVWESFPEISVTPIRLRGWSLCLPANQSKSLTSEVIDQVAGIFDSRSADQFGQHRRSKYMTDINTIASRYIDLWNERSPDRRRAMLSQHWARDAKYVDPLMSGDGHDGVDALISGVQARFPDFRFQLIGQPNGFGEHLRFSWGLGPDGADSPIKGTDFAVVQDGKIRSITGFLDQVPQGA